MEEISMKNDVEGRVPAAAFNVGIGAISQHQLYAVFDSAVVPASLLLRHPTRVQVVKEQQQRSVAETTLTGNREGGWRKRNVRKIMNNEGDRKGTRKSSKKDQRIKRRKRRRSRQKKKNSKDREKTELSKGYEYGIISERKWRNLRKKKIKKEEEEEEVVVKEKEEEMKKKK